MAKYLLILVLALCAGLAQAKEAVPVADDPVLEAQMMRIAEDMRCLECQNETLAASHAGLARDLRELIRQMLAEGKSEQQIVQFMVDRYGDFVLYRPPFKSTTWVLWLGPFGLLVIAVAALWLTIKRRNRDATRVRLAPQQAHEAEQLLSASKETST